MRKVLYAISAMIMAGATLGAAIPAASAAAAAGHTGATITSAVPGITPATVPVSGHICGGKVGGGCWWETAVQFWYDMKNGHNEKTNLARVYHEYGGKFEDGWTDDNAWWGITWQLASQKYSVAKYHTLAESLWTWDTTLHKGWDPKCGGSTLQHPGGTEDDISRAALGVLASSLGHSASAARAAAWIFKYMQGSNKNNPAAEGLKRGTCTASGVAQLGGQTESWKVEQLTGGAGQPGTRKKAVQERSFNGYNGIFKLLFQQYIG